MDEDIRVKVNDAKFHFARTFLSEYWLEGEDFSKENKRSTFFSLLKRAWNATTFAPLSSLSSVIVVSASLLIFTFILVFDFNIQRLLDEVGGSEEGLLYFKLSANSSSYPEVEQVLLNEFEAEEVRLVTKQEALKQFGENLGSHSGILNGLEGNPLPDSLEFRLSKDRALLPQVKNQIELLPERFSQVDEVVVGAPWADTAKELRSGVQKLSFIVLIFVFAVVAFIVANVVKLMLYAHFDEIEIMQLVGAPRYKVVAPYLISGGALGLLGASIALSGAYFVYVTFLRPLNSHLIFGLAYDMFKYIGLGSITLVLLLGLMLGVGGGWFALRKWVD